MRKTINKWNPIASSVGDAARRSAGSSNNGYSYSKKFETLSVTGRVTIADGVKESADLVNRYLMDMTQIRSTRQNEILCLVEHDPWLYDYFAYSFAYVNTDYYGYTNARQAAISNILASDKSRLSFYNIESDALGIQLRNFNQEYFDAAYENAKPSVKGLVDFIRHDDNFIIKRTLGKYVRAFDVAAEMGTGLYHATKNATKNTGYSLGDYALSLKHTGQAFSDAFQGESSWGEFYETFKSDERIRESIETGYWSGWVDAAVGIGTGGAGSLEYIYNDTTYIRQGVGYVTSKKDNLLVGALDLDQDTYMRAKSIASVEMTVVSFRIGLNSAKAKGSQGKTAEAKYSPINPGPLKQGVAETFTGASYTQQALKADTVFYRVSTDEAGKVGSYMTRTPQMGGMQSQLDLALNPEWGNTAQVVTKVTVPKGTVIYEGTAAPQVINGGAGMLPGGGNQIYIPEVNPKWFK